MAGRLYGVDGIGGGYITEGFIVVRRVIIDPTPYGEFAYKITEAYLWDGVLDARAIASIGAVKGACGPYYPT
ncbi:MAG: hypothetical protein P3X22_007885 [Thermoprotei archaeon]|nr:hypothetical protein [Thermoprotei archaeon]